MIMQYLKTHLIHKKLINTIVTLSIASLLINCTTTPQSDDDTQPHLLAYENTKNLPEENVTNNFASYEAKEVARTPLSAYVNAAPSAPLNEQAENFINSISDERIYFAYNRFDIVPEARAVLREYLAWFNANPKEKIVIIGNADERGTREYNLALGARRAQSVKDYMVSQGYDSRKIITLSYGKERPVDPRSNEQAWATNRNAHTAVLAYTNF